MNPIDGCYQCMPHIAPPEPQFKKGQEPVPYIQGLRSVGRFRCSDRCASGSATPALTSRCSRRVIGGCWGDSGRPRFTDKTLKQPDINILNVKGPHLSDGGQARYLTLVALPNNLPTIESLFAEPPAIQRRCEPHAPYYPHGPAASQPDPDLTVPRSTRLSSKAGM